MAKILLIAPFYSGSHRKWADQLIHYSSHEFILWTLPGRHWKWRMHGAAVHFAHRYRAENPDVDLILTTDILDVATFKGIGQVDQPILLYFHENQLAYPWSETDKDVQRKWDRRYMWINLTSALAADACWFNSSYNQDSFLAGIPHLLQGFPDKVEVDLKMIRDKSTVIPVGIVLPQKLTSKKKTSRPIIIWNHRWEYDKNPELFFNSLITLSQEGYTFDLVVLGEKTKRYPVVFDQAKGALNEHIIHWGPVSSQEEYHKWLQKAHLAPVTSQQDFFGISVVEAVAAGCTPLWPLRLAYPEHLLPDLHYDIFYDNDVEFLSCLRRKLMQRNFPSYAQHVRRYDWSQMKFIYDNGFLNMINK